MTRRQNLFDRGCLVAVALAMWMSISPASADGADSMRESPDVTHQVPTLSEGHHIALPPIVIPVARPARDLRPVWVGAGLVVIAAVFWWNQRRRASLGQSDRSADS